jgi:hypothetical protein
MPTANASAAHEIAIEAAVALVPWVGGAASVLVGHHYRRRAETYASAVAESLTDEQLRDLEDLVRHDEQLQDLLLDGVEAAMKTRVDAKRRALGRILASAVADRTCLDEIELIQSALADIEAAHARVLSVFAEKRDQVLRSDLEGAEPGLTSVMSHLLAALARQGVIYQSLIDGGDVLGNSDDGYSLTEFGELLINYLTD